jgi:hypothetical protein
LRSTEPPVSEERQRSTSEAQPENALASQNEHGNEEEKEDTRAEREDSSAPGSVHDSADDESDLSDVPDMDDVEQAMIFPGLMNRTAGSSGGDGASTPKEWGLSWGYDRLRRLGISGALMVWKHQAWHGKVVSRYTQKERLCGA